MSIPVIIDTDIGSDIDDTWALAMALGCPELDIKMIVSATGDTDYRAKIICKLLEEAGRTDIPVAVGLPFESEAERKRELQTAYVEDYSLGDYPGIVHQDGIAAMARAIMAVDAPDKVALVCIGPLPNIDELLRTEPRVCEKARFIGMHGSVFKGYFGTDEIHAEFNVKQHLECARRVLSSDFDITITPLDTCGVIRLRDEHYRQLLEGRGNAMRVVLENYRIWLQAMGKGLDAAATRSSILFDTVAIYLALGEELLEMQSLHLSVTDEGKTVLDEHGKPMRVATGWKDLPKFYDLLVRRLLAAP